MTLMDLAKQLRPIIEKAMESVDDKTALDAVTLFPMWSGDGVSYAEGMRLRHNGVLYKVLTAHTSQMGWSPDVTASLFAKVLIPDENTVYDWEQPDSTNGYMTGDKVKYNGKIWVSTVDNNVWAPDAYGWSEVAE